MVVESLKFCQRDQEWWRAWDWTSCMNETQSGSGGGEEMRRNVEKNMLI